IGREDASVLDSISQPDLEPVDAIAGGETDTVSPLVGSRVTEAPYNCSCDGLSDDTSCLQAALDSPEEWLAGTLVFPAGASCRAQGLHLEDAQGSENAPLVISGYGATLTAPDDGPLYGVESWILDLSASQFVRIEGLRLDGNRLHRNPTAEWIETESGTAFNNGTTLRISASMDIVLLDTELLNGALDNLLIRGLSASGPTPADFSQRIQVVDSTMRNAFRNNVSVINCDHCEFIGDGNGPESSCQITDANGTLPEAGLDFEPNASSPIPGITNSRIDGCYVARNAGRCVQLDVVGQPSDTAIVNSTFEDCRRESATCGSAILLGHKNTVISGNVFQNFTLTSECRALIDAGGWGTDVVANATIEENEFSDIDVGNSTLVFFHANNAGGHIFRNNVLQDIGATASGHWCADFGVTTPNQVYGNTVDGQLQSPNPGCP
ncbi:MAG: hypothetical protein KC561_10135, partial [Myxococcales bacterium]|nr:hypothetical protein [Myxococcales bacterium]